MAGQRVVRWQRLSGARAFSAVARATIGSGGSYSFGSPKVTGNVFWYVTAGRLRSATIAERVRLRIVVHYEFATCGRRWMGLRGRGSVFPAQPGARLRLLARVGRGRWRSVARLPLIDGVRFSFDYRRRAPATIALRLRFVGNRRNAAGDSPVATASCR